MQEKILSSFVERLSSLSIRGLRVYQYPRIYQYPQVGYGSGKYFMGTGRIG